MDFPAYSLTAEVIAPVSSTALKSIVQVLPATVGEIPVKIGVSPV